jgi:WD40 repeat protein
VINGHTCDVNSVSFSLDKTRIATGSLDGTVRLWDAAAGRPVGKPLLGHTDSVTSVSFSLDDGTNIVSGPYDETVRLWDVVIWQPVGDSLRGHTCSILSVVLAKRNSHHDRFGGEDCLNVGCSNMETNWSTLGGAH